MKSTKPVTTIAAYIKTQPKNVQVILRKICEIVEDLAPEAAGKISYQMPAYKLNGRILIYFAAWKYHIGMYPILSEMKEIVKYKTSRGTVQFPLDKPIPYGIIKKIISLRAKENLRKNK